MPLNTSLTSFILTGCAVALFIIIMLSTPINRQLALVHIKGPDVVADIGVLGACYRVGNGNVTCPPASVGFYPDTRYLTLLSDSDAHASVFKHLTRALVSNPIAAFLGLLSFVACLAAQFARSSVLTIAAFVLLFISGAAGGVAFGINLALVLVVKSKIHRYTNGVYTGTIGTSFWLAVAAIGTYFFAFIFALLACCRPRKYFVSKDDGEAPKTSGERSERPKYHGTY